MKLLYKIYFLFLLLCYPIDSYSQAYQIKTYSVDNGIAQPYIYTINQDKNGYLWAGTGDGICRYDGVSFKSYSTAEGFAENFATATFKDDSRNLWIGHNQGSVTFYDGKNLKKITTSTFVKSPITSIVGDKEGNVWFATQTDGIFRINKKFEIAVFKTEFNQKNIFSITVTHNNQLLVGTDEGLLLYDLTGKEKKPNYSTLISSIPETKISCIVKKNNSTSYWIGTEDEGLFLLNSAKNTFKGTSIGNYLSVNLSNIQDVYEDKLSNLWVATFGNGVVKLILSPTTLKYDDFFRFSDDNGLSNKYNKTIYSDHEGNMWIGTYGSGLVQLIDNYFTFYSHDDSNHSNSISAILIDETTKWFGGEDALIKFDLRGKQLWKFYSKKNGFVDDKVTALLKLDKNNIIVGTENNGVFVFNINLEKFIKIKLDDNQLSQSINSIVGDESNSWIATKGGIFKIDKKTNKIIHYTTENGLTHNNINQIILGKDGKLWIATHSNFISFIDKKGVIKNIKIYTGHDLINVTNIIENNDNSIWVGTFGNGVFKVKDNKVTTFTTEDGLRSNYAYSVINDRSNNIWVGHRNGLSRIKSEKEEISIFDKNEGVLGDCNTNASFTDIEGYTWFGTTMGVVRFDPHNNNKNSTAPIVNVTSFKLNDKEIDFTKDTIFPYDDYRLRIDFVGISFKANTHMLFQYKLEGYDIDWSDKTNNSFAQYGKLNDGEYTFLIKAFNNDGISNPIPFNIKIVIAAPVWKRPWFVILCIMIISYVFYLWLRIRDRNHRRFELQLQKALNEKTREVILQKEEIEKKNKNITDSIKYAKRIQDAILPNLELLQKTVPQSFIFFQPRDIVSGDFCWFKKHGDLLILVSADATGHGVPGAFMSMIGATLLQEITLRKDVQSPVDTLNVLEKEINVLLKQNETEDFQSQDGVDVVICEINLKTYYIRVASTKRPMAVATNNELIILKKEYDELEQHIPTCVQLQKGDTLYLFTDGYTDQFGGDEGKKLKMTNVKTILEKAQAFPIQEQKAIVSSFFNEWKGEYEQTDDVLFIGLKL